MPAQEHRRAPMLIREKMRTIYKPFILYIKDSEGASAVEYAILVSLISTVIIVSVGFLGVNTQAAFDTVNSVLSNPVPVEENENKCGDKDSGDDSDCGIGND